MDLIYADSELNDIGVLDKYKLDIESSTNVNDCTFEIDTILNMDLINNAGYWYIEGTEYGGIIDSHKITTAKKTAALKGRTWRGVLGSKIICPDQGQAYYTVTGDLYQCIRTVLTRVDLINLFEVNGQYGLNISFKFDRYTNVYNGLLKMLKSVNKKMHFNWKNKKVIISALDIVDYSNEKELTSDLFDFVIEKNVNPANHIIGLGSGELTDRMICHKYLQADGTIGDTQYYFGSSEVVIKYDYSNVESFEELEQGCVEQLEDIIADADSLKLSANNLEADVMDIFTAHDIYTDISIKEYITNKIVQLEDGTTKISYKVGNLR